MVLSILQAPGATWRPVEWTAAPVLLKKRVVTRFSREMRVCALLWYGPYGIQHIETMNKLASNTIFSRSSVLGSTSAPAEKLTFF